MLREIAQAASKRRSTMTLFRHLGVFGLFLLAIVDSSPVPTFGGPDILTVILVVTRRNPWYEYAAAATLGSLIGAYVTFRLARTAGQAYLNGKSGPRSRPRLLKFFDKWRTGALAASTAIPFPLPTSVFFAAAGASNNYSTKRYVLVVALCRAARYSAVAILAQVYGRHIIRVLRHPAQYWGWLLVFAALFIAVIAAGILINRRVDTVPSAGD
jgi:membrane protein YqaA with SNARE-associated domain